MRKGFTLIELLVVITIIVILLALLVPAMDRAIYAAEMAVCAAQQRGIATGATVYASGNKRLYPPRQQRIWNTHYLMTNDIPDPSGGIAADDRPVLREMFSLDIFNDPMVAKVDFETEATRDSNFVFGSYNMWWSTQWIGEAGMRKMGDRFTWKDAAGVVHTFDLLVSDLDHMNNNSAYWTSSHPDKEGVMFNTPVQNNWAGSGIIVPGLTGTYSLWYSTSNRGSADYNYTHADGSVDRFDDIVWQNNGGYDPDTRMISVPLDVRQDLNTSQHPKYQAQAPPAR